jgi:hypothetical protein
MNTQNELSRSGKNSGKSTLFGVFKAAYHFHHEKEKGKNHHNDFYPSM